MAQYDLERLLLDIKSIFTSNLNTKLSAIQSEKGDGLVVPPIDTTDGYALLSLNTKVFNQVSFMVIGVDNIETIALQGNTANKYSISCVILMADSGNDPDLIVSKRLLRYQRAMREVIEANAFALPSGPLAVTSGIPQEFKFINSSDTYRAIGLFLDIAIS